MKNPFIPGFSGIPLHMAGRREIVGHFSKRLGSHPGSVEVTGAITGISGCGKTTLLSVLEREARHRGWVVAGMTGVDCLQGDLLHLGFCQARKSLGLTPNVPLAGLIEEAADKDPEFLSESWCAALRFLLHRLAERGKGLLITLDEVDGASPILHGFLHFYFELVDEGLPVALLMAGLPTRIDGLWKDVSDCSLRIPRHHLVRIPEEDVAEALMATIEDSGRTINPYLAQRMAKTTGGYGYMVQLVGHHVWEVHPTRKAIVEEDVERGILEANRALERVVLPCAYDDLTYEETAFVNAMIFDDDSSLLEDVAKRMGVGVDMARRCMHSLVREGVVGECAQDVLRFELPHFRYYLRKELWGESEELPVWEGAQWDRFGELRNVSFENLL